MVTFEESNMVFSFPDEDVYRIEKSPLLAEVRLKATECVVSKENAIILVICGHKIEWLPPLMDALKSRLRHTLKLWNISDAAVKVMNERMALDKKIIVSYY